MTRFLTVFEVKSPSKRAKTGFSYRVFPWVKTGKTVKTVVFYVSLPNNSRVPVEGDAISVIPETRARFVRDSNVDLVIS